MSAATVDFSLLNKEVLSVHLNGKWEIDPDVPSKEEMEGQLRQHPEVKNIVFNATALNAWDSSLLIFYFEISKLAAKNKIQVEKDGLPAGVRQLIELATAVPKKEDASQSVSREGFFAKVGSDVSDFITSAGELITFIGAAFASFLRMVTGRARFRASDLGLFLQEAGAQAVPIVSLISFLVGLILAFVGIVQLAMFGAEVYVADLVGIAMVREMGAIMMPFLTLYADLMGILGGAIVAVGMYDINIHVYLDRTTAAIGLNDLFIGLFMGAVFGILVALSGCMRGIQCGRSASAVGDAATSAAIPANPITESIF